MSRSFNSWCERLHLFSIILVTILLADVRTLETELETIACNSTNGGDRMLLNSSIDSIASDTSIDVSPAETNTVDIEFSITSDIDVNSYVYFEQKDDVGLQCSKKYVSMSFTSASCVLDFVITRAFKLHFVNVQGAFIVYNKTNVPFENCPDVILNEMTSANCPPSCHPAGYDRVQRQDVDGFVEVICDGGCTCTLGYRQWIAVCRGHTLKTLIVYRLLQSNGTLSFQDRLLNDIKSGAFSGFSELLELKLNKNKLKHIEGGLFIDLVNLIDLNLAINELTSVSKDAFKGLDSLKRLDFFVNKLKALPTGILDRLLSLRYFRIGSNKVTFLFTGVFDDLGMATELLLENNLISLLPVNLFKNLNSLCSLDISNNKLTSLQTGCFAGLTALDELNLAANMLSYVSIDVFSELVSLTKLNLKLNLFTSVPNVVLVTLVSLRDLRMSNNKLVELPVNVFQGLDDLCVVHLHRNKLTFIPADCFAGLIKLKYLLLDGNMFKSFPANLFQGLVNIDNLYIALNNLNFLTARGFADLSKLYSLNMDYNYLHTLPNDTFANSTGLKYLYINNNQLLSLPELVFAGLNNLQLLNLTSNNLTSLASNLFNGLTKLYSLYIDNNTITSLPVSILGELSGLHKLQLGQNKLLYLPPAVFFGLEVLEYLSLDNNNLTSVPSNVFDNMDELQKLNLSNNLILSLPEDVFTSSPSLEFLDLSCNRLRSLPAGIFRGLDFLKKLHLHNNMISNLTDDMFITVTRLKLLTLYNNVLLSLPDIIFKSQDSVSKLYLQNNHLHRLCAGVFENLASLMILDLSRNSLNEIDTYAFRSLVSLLYLNISNNNLSTLPSFESGSKILIVQLIDLSHNSLLTLEESTFRYLPSLVMLYLDNNNIAKLNLTIFHDSRDLCIISVTNNKLTSIEYEIVDNINKPLAKLLSLRLSNNQFTRLTPYVFQGITQLVELDLRNNQILRIEKDVFNNVSISAVDLRSNPLLRVRYDSFDRLDKENTTLLVDESATCCFVPGNIDCISTNPRSVYLTCKRMIQDLSPRISMWCLGLFALVFNLIVFYLRCTDKRLSVQTYLILNLSVSDFLMGVNMLLLACSDFYYAEYFPSYSDQWRDGLVCRFAGVLSILSSEVSVFLIALISFDRFNGLLYPFSKYRLKSTSVRVAAAFLWLVGIILSVMPIVLSRSFPNVLEVSEVCVGIPMVRRLIGSLKKSLLSIETVNFKIEYNSYGFGSLGDLIANYGFHQFMSVDSVEIRVATSSQFTDISYVTSTITGYKLATYFSIIVFIGINLICFVLVAGLYISIFVSVKRSAHQAGRNRSQREEIRMASKMAVIIFTDFFTWVPLVIVCILVQCKLVTVDPVVYAWTVAFILPINAAINPFLYTIVLAISDRRDMKRKQRQLEQRHQALREESMLKK